MNIETATRDDLPGIVALETGFPAGERWNDQLWSDELAAADRLVLAAHLSDLDGRSCDLVGAATFQLVGDTADLHRVVVAEQHRRRGFARVMVVTGLHWAKGSGASRLLLEVRHDNAAAVAFYSDLGFLVIGERRDYYAAGAHALVMELVLTGLDLDAVGAWGTEVAQ
ncbi:GNAT family N-acetyltransferase [Tessaracoccus rhinocerotis]|uniref:GNAT family N-acetyltransferase n=1 Tax=Tessaracoccus rhinocerotis TaxID=1689449 RepID=A0A553K563_9ACTN|nr:GNAT family N-acetyltransferase [Tessaracoccus rhinocerotis]TRY19850.1 GNAT family N-acetyltransferase [Tessaracoccus rhinocerotis]